MMRRFVANAALIAIVLPCVVCALLGMACTALGRWLEETGPDWRWVRFLSRIYDRVDAWGEK